MTDDVEPSRRYVLAFGAARYAHEELPDLPGVADDLPRVLGSFAAVGYTPVPVFPEGSLDPARPEDVLGPLLRWIPESFDDGDTLLLYYSGHGQADGDEHFLMCSRSDPGAAEVRLSALSTRHLVELPALKGVRRILLVIDACYAGRGAVDAVTWAVRAKHAVAHAPGADHRFLKSFGVLSAARITEEAKDSAFSAALSHVLADETWIGNRASHISLPDLVGALNTEFRRRGVDHHADWAQLCDDTVRGDPATGFFPNPFHVPELLMVDRDLDVAEQRHFVRWLGAASGYGAAEQQRRNRELVEHFSPRGAGRQTAQESGHYFTGRVDVLRRLAGWMRGENDRDARVFVVTGPPGVGKSAVLGRLVTLADDDARDAIPADAVAPGTLPPSGSVTVAVHARALGLPQIVSALAASFDCPEPTEAALRERLGALDSITTIVVDALDESGMAHDEERRIARFLAELAGATPRLRLLIGTRPHLADAVADKAPYARIVDLAAPEWNEPDDLVRYCELILRTPLGPHSGTSLPHALISSAANEIARAAHAIYLVARLMARSVASSGIPPTRSALDLPEYDPASGSSALVDRAFRWALARQLTPERAAEARALLLPLAYVEGHGMPLHQIWATLAADHPDQVAPTAERLTRLLRNDALGPYLVETLDEDGRSVYRLYHQALADELRRNEAPPDAETLWYERLREMVPRATDGRPRWQEADPYVLHHLAAMAAAAGRLDELVTDGEFLVHARPTGLVPWLRGLATERGRLAAAVYRAHLDVHHEMSPQDRRHVLACDAARHQHTPLLAGLDPSTEESRWRPVWAASGSVPAALSVHRLADGGGPVDSVTCVGLAGRDTIVTVGRGSLQAWDMATGRSIELPDAVADLNATAVTAAALPDHDLLVVGTDTGAVHIYDLASGRIRTPAPTEADAAPTTALVTLELAGRKAVVSASASGELRAWDLADATALPWRRQLADGSLSSLATATVDANPEASNEILRRGWDIVVAGGPQGVLYVWDPLRGKLTPTAAQPGRPAIRSIGCAVVNTTPLAVTTDGATVRVWSLRRPRAPREVESVKLPSPAVAVSCTDLGGRPMAILACEDGTVRLLDLETRELTASSSVWRPPSTVVAPSPSEPTSFSAVHLHVSAGQAVTTVLGTADGSTHVCDLVVPTRAPSDGHTRAVVGAAVTGGGYRRRYVVSAGRDSTVRAWRMDSGVPALPAVTDGVSAFTGVVAAVVDGRLLALSRSANRPVEVWDLATGTTMERQRPRWTVAAAIGYERGRPIAVTADFTHRVEVWDLISGVALHRLESCGSRVTALACAPADGDLAIAVALANGSVVLWKRSGTDFTRHRLQERWQTTKVVCVRVQGCPVAVIACDDGTIRAWDGTDAVILARRDLDGTGHNRPSMSSPDRGGGKPEGNGTQVAVDSRPAPGAPSPGTSHRAATTGVRRSHVVSLAGRVVDGGLLLATGDAVGRVTVWETPGGTWPPPFCDAASDMFTVPGDAPVTSLEFTPDGRLALCADMDVYLFGRPEDRPVR
ncbi:nSTAND1 domain-containing NTPase [Streptomyces similanensis]|uniref:Peptidase C14 caspase domain-containing protein n=1 Tax=Streptomyces similanensis TaxID=1274988 RepID=A0ABP9LAF3_9ACTN